LKDGYTFGDIRAALLANGGAAGEDEVIKRRRWWLRSTRCGTDLGGRADAVLLARG
jgi:hypothetical protein